MPSNVEIKARVPDMPALKQRAEKISDTPAHVINQDDTFFNVPEGRLKIRILSENMGELIFYKRPDTTGPKTCVYSITETSTPRQLLATLTDALGILGVVKKRRTLYLCGPTRIHLDEVEKLGSFMELEVVMRNSQPPAEGEAIAHDLMQQLGVEPANLVEGAYLDLLIEKK